MSSHRESDTQDGKPEQPERRRLCRGLLAGAAATASGLHTIPVFAKGTIPLDLDNDADLLKALIKMRGRLDSKLHIGWLRARRFAVSDAKIEPLCGLIAATFNRFSQVSDTLFEVVTLEITHYTDINTGALLKNIKMPFSDTTVEVPPYRFGPTRVRFAVDLEENERFAPAAGTTEGGFSPAGSVLMNRSIHREGQRDGLLYLRHEEHGRVQPDNSSSPSMFYKESTIWSAPLKQVLDPTLNNVDASVAYSAMTSWRPWMKMRDLPGNTMSNGFGGKAASLDDLPEDFLRYTRQIHPDVLRDPEALLDA